MDDESVPVSLADAVWLDVVPYGRRHRLDRRQVAYQATHRHAVVGLGGTCGAVGENDRCLAARVGRPYSWRIIDSMLGGYMRRTGVCILMAQLCAAVIALNSPFHLTAVAQEIDYGKLR